MPEPSAAELRRIVKPKDLIDFFTKVDFEQVVDDSSCRLWTAGRNPKGGYARYNRCGHKWVAHRFAYKLMVGEIPEGLTLDHLCKTTHCVNPFHCEPVTNAENIRRGTQGWNFAIRTHCPRGHEYNEENTHRHKGSRYCRACGREKMRERRAKL